MIQNIQWLQDICVYDREQPINTLKLETTNILQMYGL